MAEAEVEASYQYTNSYPRRGKALIFKNSSFSDKTYFPDLQYSDTDYAHLKTSLDKTGFSVELVINKRRNGVLKKLEEVAAEDSHKTADCFLCIFLTYGDSHQGLIYAKDAAVLIDEIQAPFMGDRCQNLLGKPKYFVFQASQKNVSIQSDGDAEEEKLAPTIPAEADFALYWCNMQATTFFWDGQSQQGTLFSRALANEFMRLWEAVEKDHDEGEDFKVSFLRTTAVVNSQLERHYHQKWAADSKILPLFEDSLTKEYIFRRKLAVA